MLTRKSNQMMHNVLKKITPNDARYQENQAKRCRMLSRKSNQARHSVFKQIKPNDNVIMKIMPNNI